MANPNPIAALPEAAEIVAAIEKTSYFLPRASASGRDQTRKRMIAVDAAKPAAERPGIGVFKPSRTLRRAQLTTDGHAVTWTLKGAIIDGLEIEYEPTLAEASDRINALYKKYTAAGVEVHAALKPRARGGPSSIREALPRVMSDDDLICGRHDPARSGR